MTRSNNATLGGFFFGGFEGGSIVPDQPAEAGKCVRDALLLRVRVWAGLEHYCRWYNPLAKMTGYLHRYPPVVFWPNVHHHFGAVSVLSSRRLYVNGRID